jgi:putative hydrolase
MERYPLACIAHPNDMIGVDVEMLAQAAARTGTALELNLRHNSLTLDDIRKCRAAGATFMINSDAHRPDDVGRLDKTVELALTAGLCEQDVLNTEGCTRKIRFVRKVARGLDW